MATRFFATSIQIILSGMFGIQLAHAEVNFKWTVPENDRLKQNIQFWIKVNSQYTTHEGLIHDAENINHVYEVLNFKNSKKNQNAQINLAKVKWKLVLLSIHKKQGHPEQMTAQEKKVFEMFKDVDEPNKFLNAAHRKRLRFQLGQKDRFLNGLYQSGKYLKAMEVVFQKAGLPTELTRLPFVESSFNLLARSKVGASGIWQFMRSTARLFIETNEAVDERNDPIRATEAAARLLSLNYRSLGNWPLAVTAYNHGRKGMMRAVRRVGSDDLEDLIMDYNGRSFGFASGNFYAELMALIELEKNAPKYFDPVERAPAVNFYEAQILDYIQLSDIIREFKLDMKAVKELNPGLTEAVLEGKLLVPAGYRFRMEMPVGESAEKLVQKFNEVYAKIPKSLKEKTQRPLPA